MSKKAIYAAMLVTLFLAFLAAGQGDRVDTMVGPVTEVRDGNTIRVVDVAVRLSGLAAPELGEPGAVAARDFLADLVFGQTVTCEVGSQRSFDRRIGTCFHDGQDIAATVIAAGLARDCPRYSGGRYEAFQTAASERLPLPAYCAPRDGAGGR